MINNNQNQKVYFPNSNDIIMKILEKNNLKETLEEAIEKIKQKKDCRINIIYNESKDFAEGTILEKDLVVHLQKQLEVSTQTAENLVKDIKEKLLPLGIKVNIGEVEKIDEKTAAVRSIRLINETQDTNKKSVETPQVAKKLPTTKKIIEERKNIKGLQDNGKMPEIEEIKRQPKKQDSYLESIE